MRFCRFSFIHELGFQQEHGASGPGGTRCTLSSLSGAVASGWGKFQWVRFCHPAAVPRDSTVPVDEVDLRQRKHGEKCTGSPGRDGGGEERQEGAGWVEDQETRGNRIGSDST